MMPFSKTTLSDSLLRVLTMVEHLYSLGNAELYAFHRTQV